MSAGKAQRIDHILPSVGELLSECRLCGHGCGVDRLHDATGLCRTDDVDAQHVRVSSHTLHFGEEPMLVGRGGSGAVFFSHCNLRCVFCQNYQISQEGAGREVAYGELARMFQALQVEGAENINLVTPTHYIYPILLGLRHAYRHGLDRPLVYNTNGYDSVELLALLEGVVDLYLPDLKYMDSARAKRYSSAERYPDVAKDAIAEMFRQVGGVVIQNGVARKGVIIRHLVLPNDLANTYDFLLWLREAGLTGVTLSLMSQYSPQYRAREYPELDARLPQDEYRRLVDYALEMGIGQVLAQGLESREHYLPNFLNDKPFER